MFFAILSIEIAMDLYFNLLFMQMLAMRNETIRESNQEREEHYCAVALLGRVTAISNWCYQ